LVHNKPRKKLRKNLRLVPERAMRAASPDLNRSDIDVAGMLPWFHPILRRPALGWPHHSRRIP